MSAVESGVDTGEIGVLMAVPSLRPGVVLSDAESDGVGLLGFGGPLVMLESGP